MITRTFHLTQSHIDRFALLSGDHNPTHVDPAFAATTRFGRTLCHGMLLFALLDDLLPNCPTHHLTFPSPAFAGDTLSLTVETAPEPRARITTQSGTLACEWRP